MESRPRPSASERHAGAKLSIAEVRNSAEFLDAIDFGTLNAVFDNLARRSGDTWAEEGQVAREAIEIDHSSRPGVEGGAEPATAHRENNTISLYWKEVEKVHASDPHIPIGLYGLQFTIHEMAHLRSRARIWPNSPYAGPNSMHASYGLADYQLNHRGEPMGVSAETLNEAVTEEVALDILVEYLRRTGQSGLLKEPSFQTIGMRGYTNDRIILATVIDTLARDLGVHRDQVWRGFVQEYFYGDTSAVELLREVADTLSGSAKFGSMLSEPPHRDPDAVSSRIEDMDAVRKAVERVLKRYSPRFVDDALRLS